MKIASRELDHENVACVSFPFFSSWVPMEILRMTMRLL